MLAIGLILLLIGIFIHIKVLVTLGIIGLIIGACLVVAGAIGHPVGGRNNWF
jgi:hypothetical protein